ncbi:MAG: beta-glucuronidase [Lachnospiraceae bacterium]|nr:beta-glucuronidase [Lachnospiraceae bacterium]
MLYPIMSKSRLMIDLSGMWAFRKGTELVDDEIAKVPFREAMTMPVPASYNDLTEDAELKDHYGWVYYQKKIALPETLTENTRVMLRCDAVTHRAKVYIDGRCISEHLGGFLPFEAELTPFLNGEEQLLTIAVSNVIDFTTLPVGGINMSGEDQGKKPQKKRNLPNFDFFNYAGITRPVRIYTTPKTYIEDVTVTADVAEETAEYSDVKLHVATVAAGPEAKTVPCHVEILDAEGKKIAEGDGASAEVTLKGAKLWQPLNAYLYTVRVTLGGDVYELPYGIRTVRVDGTRFLINGKPFYFKGYGKHEDTFPNGRGMNLPMNVKDISLMKWQGANSFRCSHYPYSEEMMRLADAEGIVVIDETTAVGVNFDFGGGANFNGKRVNTFDPEHGVKTFDHHMEVIRDLIMRDKNHACVVMWSIANEPDSYKEGAYEYFKPLYEFARSQDPQNRPMTLTSVVMAGGPDTDVSAKLSDVICLNRYYGWYTNSGDLETAEEVLREELNEWKNLGKPVMFTEYGADTVMGLHDTVPTMYTEEYQLAYYQTYSRVFDEFANIVGEQVWNFADFATCQSLSRIQGNKKGIFTRDRRPKLAAHFLRERWKSIPEFGYKK